MVKVKLIAATLTNRVFVKCFEMIKTDKTWKGEIGEIVGMMHMTAYDTRVLLNIVTAGTGVVTGVDSCVMLCL